MLKATSTIPKIISSFLCLPYQYKKKLQPKWYPKYISGMLKATSTIPIIIFSIFGHPYLTDTIFENIVSLPNETITIFQNFDSTVTSTDKYFRGLFGTQMWLTCILAILPLLQCYYYVTICQNTTQIWVSRYNTQTYRSYLDHPDSNVSLIIPYISEIHRYLLVHPWHCL